MLSLLISVGTAVEHFALYQYQFANTRNIFAGQIQTETAYYQPNPNATIPFPPVATLNDPLFADSSDGIAGNNAEGLGLRVLNSEDILIYGAGLYSFFDNYNNCELISTRHSPASFFPQPSLLLFQFF